MNSLRTRFIAWSAVAALVLTTACERAPEPTAPEVDASVVAGPMAAMGGGRSLSWSFVGAPSRACSDPNSFQQNQSVIPLNARGSRIMVGQSGCAPERFNYVVFDVTDSGLDFVDGLQVPPLLGSGVETAIHSPEGSEVAFGAEGDVLVTWDGSSFSFQELACSSSCTINDVWSMSPSELWAVTREGQILAIDGGTIVAEEATGLGLLWSIAASPGRSPALVVAGGEDGIWTRERNGSWSPSASRADLDCGGVSAVSVASPRDAYAATRFGCVFRFDGNDWTEVTRPGGSAFFGLAAIAHGQVVVGGQTGVPNLGDPLLSVWASSDGGSSWSQLSDPAFTNAIFLSDHGTFDLSVSKGGQKLFVASINNFMWIGSQNGGGSLVADAPLSPGTVPAASAAGLAAGPVELVEN